ncbi:hypothetical protein ABKN59_007033 [Abortiporus biennis]
MTATNDTLSEKFVQDCFHSYLKSSLTQAKAEKLLDTDVLSSAEADLMITGPALCLYFAALRSTTEPASVPLPRLSKNSSAGSPADLSLSNCPPAFRPFLIIWSQNVPAIQALAPEYQHDLARIICNLSPIATPLNPRLNGIAADLRAVAIEISMRRTFQDRYANDLQAAIDAGDSSGLQIKASFVPPPSYDIPSSPPASSSSASSFRSSKPHSPQHSHRPPLPPKLSVANSSSSSRSSVLSSPGSSVVSLSPLPSSSDVHSPTILTSASPAIELIRETLYAALADVIERIPSIRRIIALNPPRAYFAAVAFAILDVSLSSTSKDTDEPSIRGVLGQALTLSECPPELQPFMKELCSIGRTAREIEEEDTLAAVEALQHGKEPLVPRLDRVRDILEGGVGHVYNDTMNRSKESLPVDARSADPRRRTTSTENRAVAFANRINALALGMTKLRAFRERQEMVFKVLVGVSR